MLKLRVLLLVLTLTLLFGPGCSLKDKAATLQDDLVNITKDQIAMQLENSLNQQFPGVQVNAPKVTDGKGEINWDVLKTTELGNYVFYNFGDYEFRSVLTGDGI